MINKATILLRVNKPDQLDYETQKSFSFKVSSIDKRCVCVCVRMCVYVCVCGREGGKEHYEVLIYFGGSIWLGTQRMHQLLVKA